MFQTTECQDDFYPFHASMLVLIRLAGRVVADADVHLMLPVVTVREVDGRYCLKRHITGLRFILNRNFLVLQPLRNCCHTILNTNKL